MHAPARSTRWDVKAARTSPSRAPYYLFILAVTALYTLEGGVLWLAGYNYQGLTGSPLTKIHPGTYLIVAALLYLCFEHADPVGTCVDLGRRRPACVLLIVAAAMQMLSIISRGGPGAAGVIDAFMLAPLAVMFFAKTGRWTRDKLEQMLHAVMIFNACMGLFELALKHPVFPYRFDGEYSIYDLRPNALQGHPLGDATVTAYYTLALISGGGSLAPWPRLGIVLLELAALVAFGGRTGLVVTVIAGSLYSTGMLVRSLRSGRVSLLAAAAGVIALTFVPALLFALWSQGFFDAILLRFQNDGGSAEARVKIMDVFNAIPLSDLLIGPDPALVEDLRRINGLALGIENPIARMTLYQGGIVTAFSVLATGLFLRELARFSRPGMLLPMIGFLIIVNTFESLGGKTTLLTKFALMMLVMFRPVAGPAARAAGAAPFRAIKAAGQGLGRRSHRGRSRGFDHP